MRRRRRRRQSMGRRAELRDTLRDDQQYCDWVKTVEPKNKSFKKFQSFLLRVEEKTRENMRKELERGKDPIE